MTAVVFRLTRLGGGEDDSWMTVGMFRREAFGFASRDLGLRGEESGLGVGRRFGIKEGTRCVFQGEEESERKTHMAADRLSRK